MLLNFRETQRQVQAKIQNTGTSVSNANDLLPKIKDWVNDRYARIYRSFFFQEIINSYDLTLTASTIEYVFDRDVEPGNIVGIFDKTNGITIEEDTIKNHFRFKAPNLDKTGNIIVDTPKRYRLTGVHTVLASIGGSAEQVKVVSTDNSVDISPNVVRVEGLVGGVRLGEEIVITGTSEATSSNTYDANQKLTISVGTSTGVLKTLVGKITVSGNTSSTVFAEISPDEYAHKYQWLQVSPKPKSSGTQPTWEIWYKRAFRRLDNDTDIPLFDCSIELVQGAFADALREDGLEQEATAAEATLINMIKELQATRRSTNILEQFVPAHNADSKVANDAYSWIP